MTEHFAPQIMVDGHSVTPEGWMWVLGFALRGIPWAVEQASDPAFDLRGKLADYYQRREVYFAEAQIAHCEQELAKARARLNSL